MLVIYRPGDFYACCGTTYVATPFEECWDLCYSSALKFNDLLSAHTIIIYSK